MLHTTIHAILLILSLVLRVIKVVALHTHGLVLLLDHAGASIVLEVALLLVGLDGDVSIDTVEVLFLLREHTFL